MVALHILWIISTTLTVAFVAMHAHRLLFVIVGFFKKPKSYPVATRQHKYAIICPARNESKVIGHFIDSIRKQDYPQELIDIIIIADNCTDDTAQISRDKGAIVYERFNKKHVGKGYALKYLLEQLKKDLPNGIATYDAYHMFDADNIIARDYMSKMNDAYDLDWNEDVGQGRYPAITAFRDIKNFSTNVISGCFGIHFYRNILSLHRPRQAFGLSTYISGCGWMVSSRLLKDGWPHVLVTEDIEASIQFLADGNSIGYQEDAVFYDEQPIKVSTWWRQRKRWGKGGFLTFCTKFKTGVRGMFRKKSSVSQRFSTYDTMLQVLPPVIVAYGVMYNIAKFSIAAALDTGYPPVGTGLLGGGLMSIIWWILFSLAIYYCVRTLYAGIICFSQRKHIKCPKWKTALYCMFFPLYEIVTIITYFVALFQRIKWVPIEHTDSASLEELEAR